MPEVVSDIVVTGARLFYSPVGTAIIPVTLTPASAWPAPWNYVGYTLDPLKMTYAFDVLEVEVEQSMSPVRRTRIKETLTLATVLAQQSADLIAVALAGSSVPTAGTSPVNEIQTVAKTGAPTGGNFTLTFNGATTGPIDFDASATEVQAELRALSTIGPTGVTVTGVGPWVVTFAGPLAATNVPIMTKNAVGLIGGTSPDITITETTPGSAGTGAYESVFLGGDLTLPEHMWGVEGVYVDGASVLRPIRLFVWRATSSAGGEIDYGRSTPAGVPLELKGLGDTTKTVGQQMMQWMRGV